MDKTPLTTEFLQFLSETMRKKQITKSALARHLGLRRQHIQSWMNTNGKRHCPSSENILLLQKYLKSLQ